MINIIKNISNSNSNNIISNNDNSNNFIIIFIY